MDALSKMMLNGDYEGAFDRYEQKAKRDKSDDFQLGAALACTEALLLQGRFSESHDWITSISAKVWNRRRVSLHMVYSGLSLWYQGRHREAVTEWTKNSPHYSSHKELDLPCMWLFGGLHLNDRQLVQKAYTEIRRIVASYKFADCKLSVPDSCFLVAHLLLRNCTIEEFAESLKHNLKSVERIVRRKAMEQEYLAFADVASALMAFEDEKIDQYRHFLAQSASRKTQVITLWWVFCQCELQFGRAAYVSTTNIAGSG